VAATNRRLRQAVAERQFREDLFFRLSVFPITIPPLRERIADVPLLARHFVERACRDLGRPAMRLAPTTVEALTAYPWPGNVRELQNAMERAVILADGETLEARHFNLARKRTSGGDPSACEVDLSGKVDLSGSLAEITSRAVAEVERQAIRRALDESRGDLPRAARRLGITPAVLSTKLRSLGMR
jgi:DNA-binding NtrC family response regulator